MQIRSAIWTILFEEKISYFSWICLDICSSLHFNTTCNWSARFSFCAKLCSLLKQALESNFGKMVHYFVVLGLFFVLPLAVTIFSYRKVLKKIQEHNTGTAQSLRINNETVTSNEIRLSKSLFVVVFAFMLCWVPAWFITILTRLVFGNKMPRNVKLLCTFFLNISNAINPFIYAGMNPVFRREFRKLLGCKFGVKVESSLSQQSSSRRPATSWISSNQNKTGDEEMKSLESQAIKDENTETNWQWA